MSQTLILNFTHNLHKIGVSHSADIKNTELFAVSGRRLLNIRCSPDAILCKDHQSYNLNFLTVQAQHISHSLINAPSVKDRPWVGKGCCGHALLFKLLPYVTSCSIPIFFERDG